MSTTPTASSLRNASRRVGAPTPNWVAIAVIAGTGSNNTAIGNGANVGASNLTSATAVGAGALVARSNSLVLGGITGINGGTDTNVGIGTTTPNAKLHLKNGRIYIEANGQGLIMKSPNGSCFELTVSDAGALTITATACP